MKETNMEETKLQLTTYWIQYKTKGGKLQTIDITTDCEKRALNKCKAKFGEPVKLIKAQLLKEWMDEN